MIAIKAYLGAFQCCKLIDICSFLLSMTYCNLYVSTKSGLEYSVMICALRESIKHDFKKQA